MSDDLFRNSFKYYKARKPPPDLFRPLNSNSDNKQCFLERTKRILLEEHTNESEWLKYGLKCPNEWESYTINENAGLIYIKNPFNSIGQRYWIVRCLRDFPKKPHKLNLDPHYDLEEIKDWWKTCTGNDINKAIEIKKNLRWATLGYHHDWDTKVYSDENRNEFPSDLEEMCKMIVSSFGFENYLPQASIVNYYHMDSTLAPHTDHSEKNLDAPLISISFGQSAIFLIGGKTKDIEPTALYLHSGDIVIMSEVSRMCYHAVPRIVPADNRPWQNIESNNKTIKKQNDFFHKEFSDNLFWKPFGEYLDNSRININVRQVLFDNQNSLFH